MKMSDIKKILIIENQWAEFQKVATCLTDKCEMYKRDRRYKYNVLMSSIDGDIFKEEDLSSMKKKFISLADKIRIWVNPKYNIITNDSGYRDEAFKEIKDIASKADLILMDHILGGAFGCLTGIDIATDLANEKNSDLKPVIFLSKTETTDKSKNEDYDKYKEIVIKKINDQTTSNVEKTNILDSHTKWVFKGFFGDEILKEDYIQQEVVNKSIEKLIGKSTIEKHTELLKIFLSKEINTNNQNELKIKSKLEEIQENISQGGELSEDTVEYLKGKHKISSLSDLSIQNLKVKK